MSTRYTAADVTAAFGELIDNGRRVGLDTSSWKLSRGDSRVGSPYLIFMIDASGNVRTMANLGGKAREACHGIELIGRGLLIGHGKF